jgi:hypothetical protein
MNQRQKERMHATGARRRLLIQPSVHFNYA